MSATFTVTWRSARRSDRVPAFDCSTFSWMTSCEGSANTPEPLTNPQVAIGGTPGKTSMLCETVLTDCAGGPDRRT
ncbi:hypothetical protein M2169_005882 [Streptomyces sp. MJP52]|nr:hypothetical protein [Streptomyces sp. MJP52]